MTALWFWEATEEDLQLFWDMHVVTWSVFGLDLENTGPLRARGFQ
jgi:hypothetical protein